MKNTIKSAMHGQLLQLSTCANVSRSHADEVLTHRQHGELFDNEIGARYLTTPELATTLRVSVHTIRAWQKFRMITPIRFGRSVRWLLKDVLQELEQRRQKREKS